MLMVAGAVFIYLIYVVNPSREILIVTLKEDIKVMGSGVLQIANYPSALF